MPRKQVITYTRFPAIPVPAECRVRKPIMQVVRYYRVRGQVHYHLVGQSAGVGLMHANLAFRFFFASEWDRHYGALSPSRALLKTGLYAFVLGAGWSTGVYPTLARSFSPRAANILMDLATFLVRGKSSPFRDFAPDMATRVLFSRHAWPWAEYRQAFDTTSGCDGHPEGQSVGQPAEKAEASIEEFSLNSPTDGDDWPRLLTLDDIARLAGEDDEDDDEDADADVNEDANEEADEAAEGDLGAGELEEEIEDALEDARVERDHPFDMPDEGLAEPAYNAESFRDFTERVVFDFLTRELTEEAARGFFDAWLENRALAGAWAVWLFVDEIGGTPVLWVLDERNGMPLAIRIGSSQSLAACLDALYARLAQIGAEVRGVLLDETLLGEEGFRHALALVRAGGLDCVARLKEGTPSLERLLEKHAMAPGDAWTMDPDKLIHAAQGPLFGTVVKSEDLGQENAGKIDPCAGMHQALYVSPEKRNALAMELANKVQAALKDAKSQFGQGAQDINIPDEAKAYLRLVRDENGKLVDVALDKERWQGAMSRLGQFALVSEKERAASEMLNVWQLAPTKTCRLSELWEKLGKGAPEDGALAQAFPGLCVLAIVTRVLSRELVAATDRLAQEREERREEPGSPDSVKDLELTPQKLLEALDSIRVRLWENGEYLPEDASFPDIPELSQELDWILLGLGIPPAHQRPLAADLCMEGPDFEEQTLRGLPGMASKQVRGRRKGGKDWATLNIEALDAASNFRRGQATGELATDELATGEPAPKRRGRPKGSKNRTTLEREAMEAEMIARGETPPSRGRGRPKSQKTLAREALEAEMRERGELSPKRGPGRPKSQKTLEREALEAQMRERGEEPPRPRRGRPKGSKNRTTLEREAPGADMPAAASVEAAMAEHPEDSSPMDTPYVAELPVDEPSMDEAPITELSEAKPPVDAQPMDTPHVGAPPMPDAPVTEIPADSSQEASLAEPSQPLPEEDTFQHTAVRSGHPRMVPGSLFAGLVPQNERPGSDDDKPVGSSREAVVEPHEGTPGEAPAETARFPSSPAPEDDSTA